MRRDVSPMSSFSRVPLPPHAYPRSSPPVYPVSSLPHSHPHAQQLPLHSLVNGRQRADQQPAASTSSSSRSSTSHQRRERPHNSTHHTRRQQSVPAEQTARSLLQSPPTAAARISPTSSSYHTQNESWPSTVSTTTSSSSRSSSLSLDLSHGALRRLDRVLLSHITDKQQPPAVQHSASHQPARRTTGRTADRSSSHRIVQSSESAITVQLKAAHSLSILASMEHHKQHSSTAAAAALQAQAAW